MAGDMLILRQSATLEKLINLLKIPTQRVTFFLKKILLKYASFTKLRKLVIRVSHRISFFVLFLLLEGTRD